MLAPAAPVRAAGGGRHHGRRAGARGPQSAQLGVAAAHRAGAAARSRRRAGQTRCPIARIIKSEIDRLDRLVREFLAFAQPAARSSAEPVDVGELLAGGRRAHRAGGGGQSTSRSPSTAADGLPRPCSATASGCVRCCSTSRATRSRRWPSTAAGCALRGAGRGRRGRDRRRGRRSRVRRGSLPVFDAFFTTKDPGDGARPRDRPPHRRRSRRARSASSRAPGGPASRWRCRSRAGQRPIGADSAADRPLVSARPRRRRRTGAPTWARSRTRAACTGSCAR